MFISDHIIGLCSWWFNFKKRVCPVVCVCNCHVVKRWVVHICSICACDWYWYAFYDFIVFINTFAMLCAGSFMEFQCFEVKPEDDSKEITESSYDDKPSTGMFSVFWWGNSLHWCSLCTTLILWCFYCLSTRVSVNDTRLTCDKSVHLSVRSSLDKYVKVKCLSKPIRPISQDRKSVV